MAEISGDFHFVIVSHGRIIGRWDSGHTILAARGGFNILPPVGRINLPSSHKSLLGGGHHYIPSLILQSALVFCLNPNFAKMCIRDRSNIF